MDVVVGLDAGTTSTKAVAAGLDGRVVAVGRAGYRLAVPAPGHAELDARDLRGAARAALVDVAAQLDARGDRAVAVCPSSAMHGLVALDEQGLPLGPLLTWGDGRAAAETARLREGPGPSLHGRTGTPVHPMSPLAKLVHLRDRVPAPPRWGGVKEVLLGLLCGPVRSVDLSTASSTGLYDVARGCWDREALALAGVRSDQLDEVVPTTAVVGALGTDLGLPAGLPVLAGATDGPLANLGVGAVGPHVVAVSLGTSGALRVVRDRFGVDAERRLFCYALTDDRWVLGGAVSNAGSVVAWARHAVTAGRPGQHLDEDEDERGLLEEARAAPAGSAGLLCLPYLLGERAPWWRGDLAGAYLGLRQDHTRAHLLRAAVEGVCQQLALVLDALPAGVRAGLTEVRATGGGTASRLWLEVLASALDLPVRVADSPEGSGLGACLLGWHALGGLPDLDTAADLVPVGEAVRPDPVDAAGYAADRPSVERAALLVAGLVQERQERDGRLPSTP